MNKLEARKFLDGLAKHLDELVSTVDVNQLLQSSNCARAEDRMVGEILFPILSKYAVESGLLTLDEISSNLTIESFGKYKKRHPDNEYVPNGSGARTAQHPFSKSRDETAKQLYERWMLPENTKATEQQWPDCGIRVNNGFNIVFEAKLVRDEPGNGATELSQGLYEASHYLGLPNSYDKSGAVMWERYDFAVFFACDGSVDKRLERAYANLPDTVKCSLWDSACIYPIIIPTRDPIKR